MDKVSIQPPRGVYDILPNESHIWQNAEISIRSCLKAASYKEIRTPIFEQTELFKRSVGEGTDIVNKEMYTFQDKSDRSMTLRPEGTASVVRAYLSNGLQRQAPPVKLFYFGPMFRYERVQKGRQRQFHQVGIEAFGSEGPAIDAESIVLASNVLQAVGINEFEIQINSIGCINCRPQHKQKLIEFFKPHLNNLCIDCRERFDKNPLRILDCKQDNSQPYFADAPKNIDHLCQACLDHWQKLLELLNGLSVKANINSTLVRGLDYYNRTVFEFVSHSDRLGAQSSILGGGRYDYLVEGLGGPSTPAIGWAMGLERLMLLLGEQKENSFLTFVVADNTDIGLKIALDLRKAGLESEIDYPPTGYNNRNISRQIQQANKLNASLVVIVGEKEIKANEASIKDMQTGEQTTISLDKLVNYVQEKQIKMGCKQ
jgi:histidyl-tRNA synthetase